ncbi:hypothetical protein [Halobaculum sp. MBLA0143]|uniref:hypothetical protein n=1 Tax=Halobaculum sp. MBLA0143 TaxID=3079933 RepID=UPI00352458CA
MTSSESHPSEENSEIFNYVKQVATSRIDQFGPWPANLFKLELEQYGVYQNFSGRILIQLQNQEKIEKDTFGNRPYMMFPNGSTEPRQTVRRHTETFYSFIHESAPFAELCVYAALCDRFDTLGRSSDFEIFPKGEYPFKISHYNEVDAVISIPHEYFPIEVYNGTNLVDGGLSKKKSQIRKNSTEEPSDVNPVLVSRLAASDFRNFTRRQNGVVADTGLILGCEENHPNLQTSIEFLHLNPLVELIPPVETDDGDELTGPVYDQLVTDDPTKIHWRNMTSAGASLPDQFCDIIAGMFNLVYVNSFYRRADTPTRREAALVLQNLIHPMMRQGGGFDTDELIEIGWERLQDNYRQIEKATQRESEIRSTTRSYIEDLRTSGIILRRSGGLYARSCTHPHASLQFPDGFKREL